jgi:GR25 family glycosyltransferase involved in LPS biosynthesis
MSIIKYPIYCINLEKDIERKKVMEKQFKKFNMNYTFCKAIDFNDITLTYKMDDKVNQEIKGYYKKNGMFFNIHIKSPSMYWKKTLGWLGCLLSHLVYSMKCSKTTQDIVCIMEDDISFDHYFKWEKTIQNIVNNAPKDWQILKLHCSNVKVLNHFISSENQYIDIQANNTQAFWSSGFYIINKNGMKELIDKFYDKKNNCLKFISKDTYSVSDIVLYTIKGSYYYSVPLVKNNNNIYKFLSNIESSKNVENTAIEFVDNFYKNKKNTIFVEKKYLLFNK